MNPGSPPPHSTGGPSVPRPWSTGGGSPAVSMMVSPAGVQDHQRRCGLRQGGFGRPRSRAETFWGTPLQHQEEGEGEYLRGWCEGVFFFSMGERLGEVEPCGHSGVTSSWLSLQPPARTTSARGRCSRFLMWRLFLERARGNGISIYQGALNSMDSGSSSDGEKNEENDKRTAVNAVLFTPRVVPVPSDASCWTPALAQGPKQREYISRLPCGVAPPPPSRQPPPTAFAVAPIWCTHLSSSSPPHRTRMAETTPTLNHLRLAVFYPTVALPRPSAESLVWCPGRRRAALEAAAGGV